MKPTHSHKPENSTAITELQWFADGRLVAIFKGGKPYTYATVPEDEYLKLVKAESIGRHFGQFIKPRYRLTDRPY